ncbi:MAG TPA: hypothetical protein VLL08_15025 [Kineosporiaceae bacterium]|nr:hypothetical protein [Kineosporiaceae bacterium]
MTQQAGIVVLIDVDAAVESKTLLGNTYLVDNTGVPGCQEEGTEALVTDMQSSHWIDGSQADEQILNWLLYALGSLPPTLPRNYRSDQVRRHERVGHNDATQPEPGHDESAGQGARVRRRGSGVPGRALLDVHGRVLPETADGSHLAHSRPAPVLVDITGEAVDLKIIYPALYGSPDRSTEGWYWSATVDTSRPGTYAYTMTVELRELMHIDGGWHWMPHRMTFDAAIRITSKPCLNGFTGAGIGVLPLPVVESPPEPFPEIVAEPFAEPLVEPLPVL